jgi:multiple sugar transport system permease protein
VASSPSAPPALVAEKKKRRKPLTRAQRDARAGLAMVSPTFVVIVVMVILPVIWALILSFERIRLIQLQSVDLLTGPYTLRNYELLLGSDEFWSTLLTTLQYSIFGTTGAIVLGLIAALLVRRPFRGRGLVRGAMLLPWVAPVVAITFVWTVLLSPQLGLVNAIGTDVLGWDAPIPFLSQEEGTITLFGISIGVPTALVMVILFESWRSFPFAFLFILARLQAMSSELEEAAKTDGATPTQVFRYIILPQIAPVIALIAVLRFIFTFNSFDEIYLLTGGGAGTEVLATQVYSFLTARNDVGGAAAVAMVMAAFLVVFLLFYAKFFGGREERM